mmetsp:Transcript_16580/g.32134  ORF Transcript_16580/g.32134 Transcript_16580/m.32134 type:complete len:413 (-) Transcript_16580:198-1436(-)
MDHDLETTRLTRSSSSDLQDKSTASLKHETEKFGSPKGEFEDDDFQVINKPLTHMSLKTQIQVASLIKREPLMQACGKTVRVEFQKGPLGLQLADVGPRVLVTALENNSSGEPGQAKRSGVIEVGHQVVAVAGRSCLNLSMRELLHLIAEAERPMFVDFQPLIIPKFPSRDRETIFSQLGEDGELEVCGEPYEVEFHEKFLGLNVGNVHGIVVVSQFMDGGDPETLKPISLGDRLLEVKSIVQPGQSYHGHTGFIDDDDDDDDDNSDSDSSNSSEEDEASSDTRKARASKSQKWRVHDCRKLDFAQIAAIVRDAGRPVRIVFEPTKVVRRPIKRHVLNADSSAASPIATTASAKWGIRDTKPRCPSCRTRGPVEANYCWKCGYRITRATKQERRESKQNLKHEQELLVDLSA